MSTASTLDPEVAELLLEVARDPRSHLLKVPDLDPAPAFEPYVRVGEPFLTAAERHLLAAHRAEVAQLLVEAAIREIYDHPRAAWELTRYDEEGRPLAIPDRAELRERTHALLDEPGDDPECLEATSLLARCVGPTGGPAEAAVKLALASTRLRPREETTIALAVALDQAGQTRSALDLTLRLVGTPLATVNQAFALTHIGVFEWTLGRWEASLNAYRRASEEGVSKVSAPVAWFVVGVRMGDRHSALRAAQVLEENTTVSDPAVTSLVHLYENRVRVRGVDNGVRGLFRDLFDILPSVAREVARVFV